VGIDRRDDNRIHLLLDQAVNRCGHLKRVGAGAHN
jgi:hypothetical protein